MLAYESPIASHLTGAVLLDHIQNLFLDLRREVDPLRSVYSYKVAAVQDTLRSTLHRCTITKQE